MSFSLGIVGLPNVGKSTLFKALTKKQVAISDYPFCTISPNVGVVAVPDERLNKLAEILKPKKIVPTTIEFVDIAGLVKNAHLGEGLGNQFLAHIREVDAIVEVIRNFKNPQISHVAGEINPKSDKETIALELIFADLETLKKHSEKLKKLAHGQDKEATKTLTAIEKIKTALEAGKLAKEVFLETEEKKKTPELNLLTAKPIIYVLNIDESDIGKIFSGYIPISAKIESELAELPEAELNDYLKELNLSQGGLQELIKESYKILNLITFFTTQNNILQAWTIAQNTKAPQAAGRIHTDFEKNFIKAEVTGWQNLVAAGSEHHAREKGLIRTEGKDYVVADGDVIHFKTGL